jgi:hypothetical protein
MTGNWWDWLHAQRWHPVGPGRLPTARHLRVEAYLVCTSLVPLPTLPPARSARNCFSASVSEPSSCVPPQQAPSGDSRGQ